MLVGPNGYGKSTLIELLESKLNEENLEYLYLDAVKSGANRKNFEENKSARDVVKAVLIDSEGQNYRHCIGDFANKIGKLIKNHKENKQLIVLMDTVDSGISIDGQIEIRGFIDILKEDIKRLNIEAYIIITTNSFELTQGNNCINVRNKEEVKFNSYEEFREFILYEKSLEQNIIDKDIEYKREHFDRFERR